MSAPAPNEITSNSSPFDLPAELWLRLWVAVAIVAGIIFYASFGYQQDLLNAGGDVWNFFRNLSQDWI